MIEASCDRNLNALVTFGPMSLKCYSARMTNNKANEIQVLFTFFFFTIYNARKGMALTVRMLIDIGENRVDLKSVAQAFSKDGEDGACREERRKSGRKSRGPFLLEGKR